MTVAAAMGRMGPRSLVGQLALLVAIALLVAQAVNFALLLQGARSLRQAQTIGPLVSRIVTAVERDREGLPPRGRAIRISAHNPVPATAPRKSAVEQAVAMPLTASGETAPTVLATVRAVDPDSLRGSQGRRTRRLRRAGAELVVAVESAPGRWLVISAPWPRGERALIWRILGQTLIIYVLVLGPVIWIGRRIARPLHALGAAARGFSATAVDAPVPSSGPQDVRDLISAFNGLRTRVMSMLDEKDRMLGAIGHDLRTPLAALRVRIENVEDEADRQRMVDTVDEMNRLLDDILSLARVDRGGESATDTDLVALVDAVVDDFRDLGAAVSFDPAARIVGRVRPAAMRRAVRNLIENAVKYAGGAEVEVTARDDGVRIVVADRGPGIAEERLADVLEPFARLETSRNRDTGGVGLGLALARGIVAEGGGTLSLANRAGGGLRAVIALPAYPLNRKKAAPR